MKTEKNILVAFILNVSFSIFEIIGGIFTNSISILSDAVHDFADAISIGISYFLEKKSKHKPDENYTYGYARYSILGAFITTTILTIGSSLVVIGGINRLFNPEEINYNGMIIFAILGLVVNSIAAYSTREGDSINQKAVNLHMLEDVLGWVVVLIGSILMKFTDISLIDSIISILVALFILYHAFSNFKRILDIFLVKTPQGLSVTELKSHLSNITGVIDIHHMHLWSLEGTNNYATMHVVTNTKTVNKLKQSIRQEMSEHGICHVTIEIETPKEQCTEKECNIKMNSNAHTHHHHH